MRQSQFLKLFHCVTNTEQCRSKDAALRYTTPSFYFSSPNFVHFLNSSQEQVNTRGVNVTESNVEY